MSGTQRIDVVAELDSDIKESATLEFLNLLKTNKEIEDRFKDTIVLDTLRKVNNNMGDYKDKMLEVCTFLNKNYDIEADRIQKILDGISDNYIFYRMHGSEYAFWIALGVNCQRYTDKRQVYIAQNLDDLK